MQSIENRITALEAKASAAAGVVFVWRDKQETEAEALKRAGISPANTGRVLVFSWLDAKL